MGSNAGDVEPADGKPQRVRVTAPSTRSAPDLSALLSAEALRERTQDRDRSRRLIRSRWRAATRCLAAFITLLVLVVVVTPMLEGTVNGVPVRWLALAAGAFAAMLACSWWFSAATEAIDEKAAAPSNPWDAL